MRAIIIALMVAVSAGLASQSAGAKTNSTTSTNSHMTWGIITGTLYFNRMETKKLAVGGGSAAAMAVFIPPPFDAAVGAGGVYLATVAAWADAENKCLKVKIAPGQPIPPFGIYGPKDKHGRWCR